MTQALYRKWRSQTFDEVIGQEHVTQTLRNALREDRVAHAYLFSGPRGTGKTTTARILAKALNCAAPEHERPCNRCPTCVAINEGRMLDLIEIDAASNNSVDDIRELRDKVGFRPSEGHYKIYIIDEVHMLSTSAFNALLKTLEEPPPHARFILATTEPHRIPATVVSRCQRFDFRRIPVPEIVGHLRHIVASEGFAAEEDALLAIARSAQGCMRDAISLLDQMLNYAGDSVTLAQVQQSLGVVSVQAVAELVDALATKSVGAGLKIIQQLMTEGASLNEFCHQIIEHLRGVMVLQMTSDGALLRDLPSELVRLMQAHAERLTLAETLFSIKRFGEAARELKGGYQPQLPLELAFIESIRAAAITAQPAVTLQPTHAPAGAPKVAPASPAPHPKPVDDQPRQPPARSEAPLLDSAAVQKLRAQWKKFLEATRQQCGHSVQGALRAVRDIAVANGSVAFAFGDNQFSLDIVAKPETLAKVTAILSDLLGRNVTLECQLGEKAILSNIVDTVPASLEADGADPLLEYAISSLGAKVLE